MTENERSRESPGDNTGWTDAGRMLGEGIGLVFTDRHGGVSPPPFDSLNLAYHTGDEPENVRRNREKAAKGLGVAPDRFVYLRQAHGLHVAGAGSGDASRSRDSLIGAPEGTDGAFTTQRRVVLSVLTADCVPIALALPEAGMVAMLHAGWRGTVGNIVASALRAMGRDLAPDAVEIRAVMGPAIGPCCYEVDEGRARLFVERYGESSAVVRGTEGWRVDLLRANFLNLTAAGVREENIGRLGGCTCCESRYFSFRRDGVTGRQGAYVFLR